MGRAASALIKIRALLADGRPRSSRDIARELGWGFGATSQALRRAWEASVVLRTVSPIYETERRRRGRAGVATNLRGLSSLLHLRVFWVIDFFDTSN